MTAVIGNEPVDGQTLELKAAPLVVTKRTVTGTTVRVSTVTREVEQEVDERLDHELVDVERVPIGKVVEAIPEIREEDGVTIVPVVEEVVVVERLGPAARPALHRRCRRNPRQVPRRRVLDVRQERGWQGAWRSRADTAGRYRGGPGRRAETLIALHRAVASAA